jgi:hypothetical protein
MKSDFSLATARLLKAKRRMDEANAALLIAEEEWHDAIKELDRLDVRVRLPVRGILG